MIRLFWCARTRAARAVWLLEEAGLPFEVVEIDLRDTISCANPEFRAASPMGKVPALVDGAVAVSDSAAIALYIADRYPQSGLAPAIDDPDRGRYLFWMTFTPGVIEPAMAEKFSGAATNRRQHGWGDYDLMLETLTGGLAPGPWLLGDRFSAADILVGSTVQFLRQFGIMPENQMLAAYADRCIARPAYQRAHAREPAPA